MKKSRAELIETIRSDLTAHPEIEFAYLHGSFQRGGPYRDIDIAVWVDPARAPAFTWSRYALDVAVDLGVVLGAPVDVQALNDAPLAFRYHALKGEPLVVRDWDRLDDIRARTWDDYFDFLPFARQYWRDALSA